MVSAVSVIFAGTATVLTVIFYGIHAVITCNNQKNRIIREQTRYGK